MYISDVRIENYRTFQDVTFHFDSRANYIVGDNNIGKSKFFKNSDSWIWIPGSGFS